MKACPGCGEPVKRNRTRCHACLVTAAAVHARSYQARRALGLCPLCGGRPKPGRKQCQACRDKANEYHRTWRAA